jgi:transcriptional regulator with XRE-family HTH domain/tetratricopeptide (TPR) repeat protein
VSDPTTFGTKLRELRKRAHLSLADLSELVHYSRSLLSRVENGHARPQRTLAELCDQALQADGELLSLLPANARPRRRGRGQGYCALPDDTALFAGREDELRLLREFLAGTSGAVAGRLETHTVCAIHGMPGVGKTALAVRAAHQMRAQFDACVFVDLRGYESGKEPMPPGDALDRLLRQLGVPEEAIAPEAEARAALLREQLRQRRVLVVLDNAYNAAQARAMLANAGGCRIIVTSRSRLAVLDEAWHLHLSSLPESDAQALFVAVAGGSPTRRDEAAVARIVQYCGGLPLALRVAAGRCRSGEAAPADLAATLTDRHARLAALDDGERSATAAFATSLERLPPRARETFVALGLHPGEDVDRLATAALTGTSSRDAAQSLTDLSRCHLLTSRGRGRFGMHDLVRDYASARGQDDLPGPEGHAALVRLIDFCLAASDAADRTITPYRYRVPLEISSPSLELPEVGTYEQAKSWLDVEQHNLMAVCRAAHDAGAHTACWQLAYTLRGYFFLAKRWDAWTRTHQWALAAARRAGDRWAEATTSNNLGLALIEQGDVAGAATLYRGAMRLFHELGDTHGVSTALGNYAWVHHHRGNHLAALRASRRAYAHYEQNGAHRNAAITLRGIATCEIILGHPDRAITQLASTLRMFTTLDLRLDAAMALNQLSEAYLRTGDAPRAVDFGHRAIKASRRCGSRFEEAHAHERLATIAWTSGRSRQARHHWRAAWAHYRAIDPAAATRLERRLAQPRPAGQ